MRHALTAPSVGEVEGSAGIFDKSLPLETDPRFTDDPRSVRDGDPMTADAARALVANAATTSERAAMSAVSDGESIWICVVDEEGLVLSAGRVDLRPRLVDA